MTLADRVEQASGPDRDIDWTICVAFNTGRSTDPRNPGPRHYTASLDAAMTLMPEGFRVEAVMQEYSGNWCAEFEAPNGHIYEGNASTEVLARLAAIVRAHEQGGEGE